MVTHIFTEKQTTLFFFTPCHNLRSDSLQDDLGTAWKNNNSARWLS